jgi:threonine dehydrogenase-like Zn-dependent dehydrogenase
MSEVRAVVQTGPGKLELARFPRPRIGPDDALLRVEACGICGTDYETFRGDFPLPLPAIPGHEPVGTLEEVGERAAQRWGVSRGDRVVVQAELACRRCRGCLEGRECEVSPGTHGFIPVSRSPALWGGYAEYLYLSTGSLLHRIAPRIPPSIAALYNPLGAGFAWAQAAGGLEFGDSIAILGPGQRGLACAIAARACGASRIFITGLGSRDAHKLALARELGADVTIDVEREDVVERVRAETGGRGVDVVVDTTPFAARCVIDAIYLARPGGTVVLAGLKGRNRVPDFPSDELAVRALTVRGVRAVDYRSFQRAIALLESGSVPVERLHTHAFALEQAEQAVRTLAGELEPGAISVTIEPWR